MIPVANEPFRLWIGCGHYQEYLTDFYASSNRIRRLFEN